MEIRPPRSASPEEAAALVAAIERFLRDHAPPPAAPAGPPAWVRDARLRAVGADPRARHPWA
jgi:hypothetical protein